MHGLTGPPSPRPGGARHHVVDPAASEAPDVTLWAVLLLLHLSGRRGPEEWHALLAARPEIANMPLAAEYAEALRADGYISAW